MFCELSIPSASASQVETVDIKHVRHHFISRGYSAGVAAGPDTGRERVAAGCREYNVEGRPELGTGDWEYSDRAAPLFLIMLLHQKWRWFIILSFWNF